jgi:hypothetical protein
LIGSAHGRVGVTHGKQNASRISPESLLIAHCEFRSERPLHEKVTQQYGSNYTPPLGRREFCGSELIHL